MGLCVVQSPMRDEHGREPDSHSSVTKLKCWHGVYWAQAHHLPVSPPCTGDLVPWHGGTLLETVEGGRGDGVVQAIIDVPVLECTRGQPS